MDVNKILQKRLDVFEDEALERIKKAEKGAKGSIGFKTSVKAFREELERISALKLVGSAIEIFEESDGNMVLIRLKGNEYQKRHGLNFASLSSILDDIRDENRSLLSSKVLDMTKDYDILIIPFRKGETSGS